MKKILLTIMLTSLCVISNAQTFNYLKDIISKKDVDLTYARVALKDRHFEKALQLYRKTLTEEQINRTPQNGVNGDLIGEYAYVLALSHNFDYALTNIDRARLLNGKYTDFYTAQVLKLMRLDSLAMVFKYTDIPEWVKQEYQLLYHDNVIPQRDEAFKRNELNTAWKATHQMQYIRSLAILYQLEKNYPNEFIIPTIISQVFEAIGYNEEALKKLQHGIDLIRPEDNVENKQNYIEHLEELKGKKLDSSSLFKIEKKYNPRTMVYAGVSFAKKMFSLNGRVGLYTNSMASASLNANIIKMGEYFMGNIGLSAYKTWRVFVFGAGFSYQLIKDNNSFSFSPTIGLSLPNKEHSSSFDVMINFNIPFSGESVFNYNISIGRTIYL